MVEEEGGRERGAVICKNWNCFTIFFSGMLRILLALNQWNDSEE